MLLQEELVFKPKQAEAALKLVASVVDPHVSSEKRRSEDLLEADVAGDAQIQGQVGVRVCGLVRSRPAEFQV